MSVEEAAKSNDRLATLKAMRDLLASELDSAIPMNVSAIAGRLQSVLAEIADIDRVKGGDSLDELADRRTDNRNAGAKRAASTARERRPVKLG